VYKGFDEQITMAPGDGLDVDTTAGQFCPTHIGLIGSQKRPGSSPEERDAARVGSWVIVAEGQVLGAEELLVCHWQVGNPEHGPDVQLFRAR
jgi:hypothetical protein